MWERILKTIYNDEKILDGVLRISFSSETTIEEVDFATDKINLCINELSKMVNV